MPYVTRDNTGKITAIYQQQQDDEAGCWEDLTEQELVEFLKNNPSPEVMKDHLTSSDTEMVRVVEDLIELLMEKQIFVFTELPEAVQAKLDFRKQLRKDMNSLDYFIDEDEKIF